MQQARLFLPERRTLKVFRDVSPFAKHIIAQERPFGLSGDYEQDMRDLEAVFHLAETMQESLDATQEEHTPRYVLADELQHTASRIHTAYGMHATKLTNVEFALSPEFVAGNTILRPIHLIDSKTLYDHVWRIAYPNRAEAEEFASRQNLGFILGTTLREAGIEELVLHNTSLLGGCIKDDSSAASHQYASLVDRIYSSNQ